MVKLNSLSIVFPCYNDADTIVGLIEMADKTAKNVANMHEIIVVNDGSYDNSAKMLSDMKAKYQNLRIIIHEKNMGYGATIWDGLKNAKNEYIFYTDGDGQYDPGEMEQLVSKVDKNTLLVNGYKKNREDDLSRKIIGGVYNLFIKILFNIKLKDVDCDFRLIRKDALDKIDIKEHGGTMCLELVKKIEKLGGEIKEVPVSHYARKYGRSQFFKFKNIIMVFIDIPKLFFTMGR